MISLDKKAPEEIEMPFKQKLKVLSEPGLFLGHLIVREKDGSLEETHLIAFLWEKLKGFLGMPDWSNPRLVELKVMQFLSAGKNEIQSPEEIEQVKFLAWKAGLTQLNRHRHTELNTLVREICDPLQPKEEGLINSFAARYKGELYPFSAEILKIDEVFNRSIPKLDLPAVIEEVKQLNNPVCSLIEKEFLLEEKKCIDEEQEYLEEDGEYLEDDEDYLEDEEDDSETEKIPSTIKYLPANSWKATVAKTCLALGSMTLGLYMAKKYSPSTCPLPLTLQELFQAPKDYCDPKENLNHNPVLSLDTFV